MRKLKPKDPEKATNWDTRSYRCLTGTPVLIALENPLLKKNY